MRPISLVMRGWTAVQAGLGLDELIVDFDALCGDAQLVALVGPNGAGKSTLLDHSQPYRLLPSRTSSYSTSAFSFYDHFSGPEASKELEWEYSGKRYRSTLLFKQTAKTKKSEAYLHEWDGTAWQPVNLPDGTFSDGKTATYDKCVDGILGSAEMFFTAAFSAQGRQPLSSYTNGDIKGLLSELLGLNYVQELGVKANQVAKLLRVRLDAMRDDLAKVGEHRAELATVGQDLESAQTSLGMQMQVRHAAKEAIRGAAKRLADLQSGANANAEVEIKRNSLNAQLASVQQRLSVALRQVDTDIQEEKQRSGAAAEAAQREASGAEAQITKLTAQIEERRALLSRKAEIEAAAEAVERYAAAVAQCEADVESSRKSVEDFRRLESERVRLTTERAGLGREGESLIVQCNALKDRAALTDQVPCAGTDLQGRCMLLGEAVTAKSGIPALEKSAETKRDQYRKATDALKLIVEQIAALPESAHNEERIHAAEGALRDTRARQRANDGTAALMEAVAQAEQSINIAEHQIAEYRKTADTKRVEALSLAEGLAARIKQLSGRSTEAENAAQAERMAIDVELEMLPPAADTSKIEAAEQELESADNALAVAEQTLETANARIATLKERVRSIERFLSDAGWITEKAKTIETEIGCWSMLAKAFGPDGIIALSIDDAGPTLASLANDLLLSCYGPRFSVRIDTQAENQKGDLKETFDITVFDSERDDTKSVRDMSGGEKLWINEALTRAMALYQAQLSGQHYECLFADESDGALDPERKQMFIKMKRKVLDLGGYSREIFISHTPELWGLADAQIDLSGFMAKP